MTEKQKAELLSLVLDIKTVCEDRLDALTADGRLLSDAFDKAVKLLSKE